MSGKLVYFSRAGSLKETPLAETVVLGAAPESNVQLTQQGVSRQHAKIWLEGDQYWIEDLKSANGTFLNGIGIQRESLGHLDVITLGRYAELVCLLGETSIAESAPDLIRGARLELVSSEGAAALEIARGESTIGRDATCTIVLDSNLVSKVHARLVRTRDSIALQDLNSSNGTFVNGTRVDSIVYLKDGDEVCFAGVLGYRVKLEHESGAREGPTPGSRVVLTSDSDQAWKTRLVWSPDELEFLSALRSQGYGMSELRKTWMAGGSTLGREPSKAGRMDLEPTAVAQRSEAIERPQPPSSPAGPLPALSRPEGKPPQPGAEPPAQVAAPLASIRAVALSSGATTQRLECGHHVIGRDPSAAVPLASRGCSRRHAVLCITKDGVTLEDCASSNGTFVNGTQISGIQRLQNGDSIAFHDVAFRIEILTAPESAAK
jgi:pSer/pThr/pTyr-binding forkhead associated (FHA) protein